MSGTTAGAPPRARYSSRQLAAGIAAAAALAAGVIAWSAFPLSGGRSGTQLALIAAAVGGVMSLAQLAATAVAARGSDSFSVVSRVEQRMLGLIQVLPWAELMTVAVLVLEALHRSRPWHTAVLAVALTGYLLAVHLAETRAGAGVLRAQLPLLAAGLGVTALAVGAAALPGLPPGPVASFVRLTGVIIAVIVAGLALPVWLGRGR